MGAARKPKNVTSYELDVHINYLITYKAKEIKPEIKKAGTDMRLRWDQTLMPPPPSPDQLPSGEPEKLRMRPLRRHETRNRKYCMQFHLIQDRAGATVRNSVS